jgi:hypothetical protein
MRRGEARRDEGRPWAGRTAPTGFVALWLAPGRWMPPAVPHGEGMLSVLAGALICTRGRISDLLLEGDVAEADPASGERWKVLSPSAALIAWLTSATLAETPDVSRELVLAQSRQHRRNLELRAIAGIYDVEERISAFFAHLARHIGYPEGDATRIPLALDQRRVERILSAGHTQATTAFRSLVRAGTLARDAHGWLMPCSVPDVPPTETCSAPNTLGSTLPFESSVT